MDNTDAKKFLIERGVANIHLGNIDEISKLMEEYHKMKVQEYFMKRNKNKNNKES